MRAIALTVFLAGFTFLTSAQNVNHAIVIGVDKYLYDDEWGTIPELKDNIDTVLAFLKRDPVHKFQVTPPLRNKNAIVRKIVTMFQNLKVSKGDNVLIYLTGHGSQVDDLNNDEKDGKDEVFVCYDAPSPKNDSEFRRKVLIDDKLDELLTALRQKLGSSGQVFLIVESCHSGTIEKAGNKVVFVESKKWQTAFMSEKPVKTEGLAPLITFSSSRANDPTLVVYNYTSHFLNALEKFGRGSYYDLYYNFYLLQRQEEFNNSNVELTLNVNVDDPYYLRLGVFQDMVYPEKKFVRVIATDPAYPKVSRYEIDKGIYEGLTIGSLIKLIDGKGAGHQGMVTFVKSNSSIITPDANDVAPKVDDLWPAKVEITHYNFSDTLLLHIDSTVPADKRADIITAMRGLEFVRLANDSVRGYTLVGVSNGELVIKRNNDNKGIYLIKNANDTRAAMLKLQISHFIIRLNTARDSSVNLCLQSNGKCLSATELNQLTTGQKLALFVKSNKLIKDKYYCILQIEDEIIRQLVPVTFRFNESDCMLAKDQLQNIFIGDIIVGKLNGSFLLISSENPIDLREILLTPLTAKTKGHGEMNDLAKLVSQLFLNRSGNQTLYDPSSIITQQLEYHVRAKSQ
ncbi:caspase family protein [Flavisolibacter nicotianae]|uniref:caspase family protein n=1 Tax=Flavisolibacter nicotianae TaxID=2364882 RepID=UPI0013C51045|nr:caspase family protein [Flavisolibacter nicotianae]